MRVVIDIRPDFLEDCLQEFGEDGSNDAEHDLLVEIADAIVVATGQTVEFNEDNEAFLVQTDTPTPVSGESE